MITPPHFFFSRWLRERFAEQDEIFIADRAKLLKIPPSELTRWMASTRSPSIKTMRTISSLLDVPMHEILIEAGFISRSEIELIKRCDHLEHVTTTELRRELQSREMALFNLDRRIGRSDSLDAESEATGYRGGALA